jgi:hypothetical protein
MTNVDRGYAWLHELAADPSRLKPPTPRIPGLAWPSRVTLLAAREKAGKSEYVSQGVAAATCGSLFLGERCEVVTCLWLCLDEMEQDLTRRLIGLGADPQRVAIRTLRPDGEFHLAEMVHETKATLVVVDTLMSLVSGLVTRGGDAAEWTPHLKSLVSVARSTGAAMIWNHHASKGTGRYRDSTAIGAESDVNLQWQEHQHGETVRKIMVTGRLSVRDFEVDFIDGRYILAGEIAVGEAPASQVSHHARALLQLLSDAEPEGYSSTSWRTESKLAKTSFNRARRALIRDGLALGPDHTLTPRYRITAHGERSLELPSAKGASEVPQHRGTNGLGGANGATPLGTRGGTWPPAPGSGTGTEEEKERVAIETEGN